MYRGEKGRVSLSLEWLPPSLKAVSPKVTGAKGGFPAALCLE